MPATVQFRAHADIEPVAMLPGITRRTLASLDHLMICEFTVLAGSTVPLHQHPHEQVGYVVSGRLEFTVAGTTYPVGPGDGYAVPSNLVHGALALEDSVIVEAFSPPRADYS